MADLYGVSFVHERGILSQLFHVLDCIKISTVQLKDFGCELKWIVLLVFGAWAFVII